MRHGAVALLAVGACAGPPPLDPPQPPLAPTFPAPRARAVEAPPPPPAPPEIAPERSLGVRDHGIFGDLDARVQLPAPAPGAPIDFVLDPVHAVLVVYRDRWPAKVYPVGGDATLDIAGTKVALRVGDRAELAAIVGSAPLRTLARGEPAPPGDLDDDGIPDPLDVLIGAEKTVIDAARYDDGYVTLPYPGGDPPRDRGACVDVVVRALRNAGLDLQRAVFEDIAGAPAAYPEVKHVDRSIDHRRVRTVVIYFKRHLQAQSAAIDDAGDPLHLGDIVVLDTFPDRPGPEHMGIVSIAVGKSGHPLIINSWTWGYTTRPMDLLGSIPVTSRYRLP